jgi:putative oxidoreductase
MNGLFSRLEGPAHVLFRFVAGAMFMCHGLAKIFGVLGNTVPVGSQMWVGGLIELSAGLFIALGLLTRIAAFLAAGQMAVAYCQFHFKLQLAGLHWVPVINKGELALLYGVAFLWLATRGPGAWSLDRRFGIERP